MIFIPKGTKDVLPDDSYRWQYLERRARETARLYNAQEIRTPTFEHTELFLRGVGETTDVVSKEMYTFLDKGNRSVTLKPEGTAGVARAYIENNLSAGVLPVKMYYFTPVFRYENPQAGRLREHHQFGVELYGGAGADMDAEAISIAYRYLKSVGVDDLSLRINSIGCPECRGPYNQKLKNYFESKKAELCPTCLERLDKNPLRILDCKSPACKAVAAGAPKIIDNLCPACAGHMERLESLLQSYGIAYEVDPFIVRGLDYYTRTVFEFVTSTIGAQGTVCGGGRYDGLVEAVGGKPTPAVGFGMGLERLLLVLEHKGIVFPRPLADVYIANLGESDLPTAAKLVDGLRDAGLAADCDHMNRSLKSQFKYADKLGVRFVAVIGGDESRDNLCTVKNMLEGTQTLVALDGLAEYCKNIKSSI